MLKITSCWVPAGSFLGDIAYPTEEYEAERRQIKEQRRTEAEKLRDKKDRKRRSLSRRSKVARKTRAATAHPERVWDYAVIPYEIDANFSGFHKLLFKQAMRHWENFTCIQFVERTQEHPNWIVFTERPCG